MFVLIGFCFKAGSQRPVGTSAQCSIEQHKKAQPAKGKPVLQVLLQTHRSQASVLASSLWLILGACQLARQQAGRQDWKESQQKEAWLLPSVTCSCEKRETWRGISLSCFTQVLVRGEGKECREKGLESQISEMVSNFFSCKILFEILNLFFILNYAVPQPRFSNEVKHAQLTY